MLGQLFETVQESRLFPDSKTFADAVPLRPPKEILRDWLDRGLTSRADLQKFITDNFSLPDKSEESGPENTCLKDYIDDLWPRLVRRSDSLAHASKLSLPYDYVVPGGRFRELYYWDSYFTMVGLARSGHQDLVEKMIANFGSLIDDYGHIPNGTRTYYLSRSQPPFFYMMVGLSKDRSTSSQRKYLAWLEKEHGFWMRGAAGLAPGDATQRVVRLPDGATLNRYWDDSSRPRDESWFEDVSLARNNPGRKAADLWRELRAGAESGWDFSSRWLDASRELASIRCTRILPIDLNCLLYGLENTISQLALELQERKQSARYAALAESRKQAINTHLWCSDAGFYTDYDLDEHAPSRILTGAAAFPLLVGLATDDRAIRTAHKLETLLRPGGLLSTLEVTGEQWDAPNGWAPLQWVAIKGLQKYGVNDLAQQISTRWISMVDDLFRREGRIYEKYNVVDRAKGSGGEYTTVTGFGWTNGVVLDLLAS